MNRLRAYLTVLAISLPAAALAQPADDPGLQDSPAATKTPAKKPAARPTPPPPPSPTPAPAFTPPPGDGAMHETVETKETIVDDHAAAEPELYFRLPASTLFGPIGLFRTITGDVGAQNTFRVGLNLQGFFQRDFLIAGANGIPGDANGHFAGNLTIDYTPWKYLEVYLALFNTSNENVRAETAPDRKDPEVILALGDLAFGAKGRLPVTRWLDLALHAGVRFFNSVSAVYLEGAATSFQPDLAASFDLRHAKATAKVPLRFHVNFGYVLDNSIAVLPAGQCGLSTGNDACVRSRVVEKFGYGVTSSRLRLALAADAPLAFRQNRFGLDLIFEYHVDFAVSDGDQTLVRALRHDPSVTADRLTSANQHYLTFGLRLRPVAGLIVDAGLDLGLASFGWQYGSPLPTWNVILGLAYAYDGVHRGRTKIIEKTITREHVEAEGKLRGCVRDATTKQTLSGVTVRYLAGHLNAQLTGADGCFVSYGLPPGPVALEVFRDDYELQKVRSSVTDKGETAIEILLTPKPPKDGTVHIKVSDEKGAPVAAHARLTSGATGAVADAEPEGNGLAARAPAGDYVVDVSADGYAGKQPHVTIAAGQEQTLEVLLRRRSKVSHVTLTKSEIVIRGTIHFATGSAELRPDGEQLLDEVVDVMQKHPELKRVRIEGHTDNRGGAEHNLQLSKARAASVLAYLVKQGVAESRLVSEGYGLTQPIVPNITPAARAKNRRVAFKILETAP